MSKLSKYDDLTHLKSRNKVGILSLNILQLLETDVTHVNFSLQFKNVRIFNMVALSTASKVPVLTRSGADLTGENDFFFLPSSVIRHLSLSGIALINC